MRSYTLGITKDQFVAETKRHQRLDHFLKGTYSEGVRGCAVGCAIKSINRLLGKRLHCSIHAELEYHGICPEWLARLQDIIFEGLPLDRAKSWPVEFAEAINTGADLATIKTPFIVYILEATISYLNYLDDAQVVNKEQKRILSSTMRVVKKMLIAQRYCDSQNILIAAKKANALWSKFVTMQEQGVSDIYIRDLINVVRRVALLINVEYSQTLSSLVTRLGLHQQSHAVYMEYADKLLELMRACK